MEEFDPLLLRNQLCFPLYAASKALTRSYEPYLEPLNLTYTQYIVMMAMWEKKRCDVKELGEMVCLDSGTLSPLLSKLVSKGYLSKSRQADGRYREISLTQEGEKLREKALEVPSKIGSCVRLSPEEAALLYKLAYKVLENLQ